MNNKGMSAIVTTVIMIGLVIVAIGIVWAVVMGIIKGQTEELDYSQMCIGVNLEIQGIDCSAPGICSVTIKRALGSKTDAINGVGITLSTDNASDDEEVVTGNIAVLKIANLTSDLDATKADMRIYVNKSDGTPYWCNQISSYP